MRSRDALAASPPLPRPGADRTLAACIELTGLRCGAAYAFEDDGSVALCGHVGFDRSRPPHDFFGQPEVLIDALERADGHIARLHSTGIDPLGTRSVLARAGLSIMVLVPMQESAESVDVVALGAPRASARWRLGRLGHTQRVSHYSQLLASLSGQSASRSELIGRACALHDVGKLALSDATLLKAGPLTSDERRHVERHAEHGAAILGGRPHPLSQLGASIAWTHHERWDGSGYPRGLAGHEIPLEGRIAAIADVFDALTSDRSYRPAMAPGEAIEIMQVGAGSHFDPRLLRLFLRALPRVAAIRERHIVPPRRMLAPALG